MSVDFNLTDAAGKAIAVALQPQMDAIVNQTKTALAQKTGRTVQQVTYLEVARYLTNLPTADLTDRLGNEAELAGKAVRNALMIGLGSIAVAIVVSSIIRHK